MLSVEGMLSASPQHSTLHSLHLENMALENAGLEKCGNKNMAIVEWLN